MHLPPMTPRTDATASHSGSAYVWPRPRTLALVRAGWLLTALAILGTDVVATPVAWRVAQIACASRNCGPHQLTPSQVHQLHALGFSLGTYATYVVAVDGIGTLVFVAMAALIFWLRSDDHMALFGAFMLLIFSVAAFGSNGALLVVNPAWSLPISLVNVAGQSAFYTFFCVFPNGRFIPRWLRWAALAWTLIQIMAVIPYAELQTLAQSPWLFVLFLSPVIIAQVYRYRRASTYREREQTKWVMLGFTLAVSAFLALLLVGNVILSANARDDVRGVLFADTSLSMLLWLIPISIGIAILRSKLWDIDIIIRRTLIYGILTALLAAVYFVSVLLLQSLFARISGQGSNAPAIVMSTLAIAALFHPLRRRVQTTIDRRFYRRTYDTAQMLATFASTLRTETDLNELTEHLVAVVREALHPEHISLWLRAPKHGE